MKYRLKITKKAKSELQSFDFKYQRKIVEKLRFFIAEKNPLKYAQKLKNKKFGVYRFRVGEYRIIFDIDKDDNINILIILRIKHRKNVYER